MTSHLFMQQKRRLKHFGLNFWPCGGLELSLDSHWTVRESDLVKKCRISTSNELKKYSKHWKCVCMSFGTINLQSSANVATRNQPRFFSSAEKNRFWTSTCKITQVQINAVSFSTIFASSIIHSNTAIQLNLAQSRQEVTHRNNNMTSRYFLNKTLSIKSQIQIQALVPILWLETLPVVVFITQTYNCGRQWLCDYRWNSSGRQLSDSTAPWRTQNAADGGCWTVERNWIGAVTQRSRIWWNIWVRLFI